MQVIFHPSLNVATLHGSNWIAAWQFGRGDNQAFLSGTPLEILFHGRSEVTDPAFSSCGQYLIFKTKACTAHTTVSIPERFLVARRAPEPDQSLTGTQPASPQTETPTGIALSSILKTSSEVLDLRPGQSLGSGMVLLGYNGRPSEVISLSGGKNVTITKTSLHGGGEEDKLSIVALPQYAGAKNTMPTILIPAPGDSSVRIIVNK